MNTKIAVCKCRLMASIANKKVAPLFGLWLATFCAMADSPSTYPAWEQVKERDGITVYQREVPGLNIKEVRAISEVAASMNDLLEIITDLESYGKINKIVSAAGHVHQRKPDSNYYFIVLDIPWPITDRSAIYSRKVTVSEDKQNITITDRADSELDIVPAMKGTIRLVQSMQEWKLEKMSDCSTKVSLTSLTDPGGPIPASLVNSMSIEEPLQSIVNLRELVSIPTNQGFTSVESKHCAST